VVIDATAGLGGALFGATQTTVHRQWGVALLVALDGELEVDTGAHRVRGRAIVVPADMSHVTRAAGPWLGCVLDADEHRQALVAARRDRAFALDGSALAAAAGPVAAALAQPRPGRDVGAALLALTRRALPTGPAAVGDTRIAGLLAAARAPGAIDGFASQAALAAQLGITPSRLSTLFHRQVGTTLRAWLAWRRTTWALAALQASQLAHAAHRAGFADHAHMTRTFGHRLGFAPRQLARVALLGTMPGA
jgi:AraC-like DNA-binding protein